MLDVLWRDFEDVTSLDCSGISFLIGLYGISNGRLALVKIQPSVRAVLDITRLSTVILLAADIESGLAALCGKGLSSGRRQLGKRADHDRLRKAAIVR